MELWSPPHDAPHLFEWWRPLVLAARRARAERFPWPVHVDEFRLAGRVSRPGRPDVWIYEHHANGGALCVDHTGEAYRFVATPGGASVGQFRRCALRTALWRAGLPEVVEPVRWGRRPDGTEAAFALPPDAGRATAGGDDGGDGAAGPGGDEGGGGSGPGAVVAAPRVVRRRHLTLVAGCA